MQKHMYLLTPLLCMKNTRCLTISKAASKTVRLQFRCNSALARAIFFPGRESEDEIAVLVQDMTSLFAFLCLSCTAMPCRPLRPRCAHKSFLHIWRAFFVWNFGGNKNESNMGPRSSPHLEASFCLRGACAVLARRMQLHFSDWGPVVLTCSAKTSAKTSHLLCMRRYVSKESIVMSMYCICCVTVA